MSAKAKDMTAQAIKGDEYNPDNTIGGMLSSWFGGAFTSGVASGISIKIPYVADAVHTIVEDIAPTKKMEN